MFKSTRENQPSYKTISCVLGTTSLDDANRRMKLLHKAGLQAVVLQDCKGLSGLFVNAKDRAKAIEVLTVDRDGPRSR